MANSLHRRLMADTRMTAFSLFLFSIGAGLLSLTIYRMLSFLYTPTGIFLLVFMAGMPAGGILAAKRMAVGEGAPKGYQRGLVLIILTFVLGVFLFLVFTNFIGRAWDLGVVNRYLLFVIFIQSLLGAVVFLPYFAAYGYCEFEGYRLGTKTFMARVKVVYAIYLVGLGCAYLIVRYSLPALGLFRFIPLSFLIILTSLAISRKRMTLRSAALSIVLLFTLVPDMESGWIRGLDLKRGTLGADYFIRMGAKTIYQGWGRYCHLTFMRWENGVYGFYDRVYYWMVPDRKPVGNNMPLFLVQLGHLKKGASIAVIGAGGGMQVKEVMAISPRKIVAVEIVPEVFDELSGPYSAEIGRLLNDPRVELVRMGGRQYLETSEEKFDLIYLSSVEVSLSAFRNFLEPSMYLYTNEAMRLYLDHLKPGGILLIEKASYVDLKGTIFHQTWASLRAQGWRVEGFLGPFVLSKGLVGLGGVPSVYWRIISHKDPWPPFPPSFLQLLQTMGLQYLSDSERKDFPTITDDNPYPVSLLPSILTPEVIMAYLVIVGIPLLVLLTVLIRKAAYYLGEGEGQGGSGYSRFQFVLTCILVGGNFILLENFVIFQLFQVLPIPMDAFLVGTLVFLGSAVLGNALRSQRLISLLTVLAILSLCIIMISVWLQRPLASILAASPLYFLTGRFFPTVFQGPPRRLVAVFILDLVGTILGGGVSLFLPMTGGFRVYNLICVMTFVACHYAVSRLSKPAKKPTRL